MSGTKVAVSARRQRALELALSGMTVRAIGDALDVSHATTHRGARWRRRKATMHLRSTKATATGESPALRPANTASRRCRVIIPPTSIWTTATTTASYVKENDAL